MIFIMISYEEQAKSYVISAGEMVEPAFLFKQMENFLNLTKLDANTWEEVRQGPSTSKSKSVGETVQV